MEIVGVYPIDTIEPCHLIEVLLSSDNEKFNWGDVTQETTGQPRENWQVAYDEKLINPTNKHWVFFFHYLNLSKPLITPEGEYTVPNPSVLPSRLKHIKYEAP